MRISLRRLLTVATATLSMLGVCVGIASAQEMPRLGAVQAGGGVSDFAGAAASNLTKLGAEWDVRVALGMRYVSIDAGYVGTTHPISGPLAAAAPGGASIRSNGLEGLVNYTPPLHLVVQPFIFAGVGWDHWSLSGGGQNDPNAIKGSNDTLVIPWGAGARYGLARHWDLDGRFTYRTELLEEFLLMNSAGQPNAGSKSLANWTATARLGYVF